MAIFDRLRRALDGWLQNREERDREFLATNTAWQAAEPQNAQPGRAVARQVDREGLQAAFLDQSGRIAYFLDTESGDVVEARAGEELTAPRFRRVPSRTAQSDDADRVAFIATVDAAPVRERLAACRDAAEFRRALSGDRTFERTWYVFRNDRATMAIEEWLKRIGMA